MVGCHARQWQSSCAPGLWSEKLAPASVVRMTPPSSIPTSSSSGSCGLGAIQRTCEVHGRGGKLQRGFDGISCNAVRSSQVSPPSRETKSALGSVPAQTAPSGPTATENTSAPGGPCQWTEPPGATATQRAGPPSCSTSPSEIRTSEAPVAAYSVGVAVVIGTNLRKEISGDVLFDGVSFKVERRDRVALAGPNGAGKTTLLRMLAGETEVHGGELAFQKGARVALHDQRPPLDRELSLREYVLGGARDLVATEEELRRLEQAMADGDHSAATLRRYADAQGRLEHAGGYAWRERTASVIRGLGFRDQDLDRRLTTFSGGELTRASLARALGGDPDLLLLDEPTNHLDVASLEWLERELASLDAGIVLVAHDRWFLEAGTNTTPPPLPGRATFFPGPWHAWRLEKAQRAEHAQKTADRIAVDIARLERFVERFRYKKDKAKQAQAKLTQIGRLEKERSQATGEVALLRRRTRSLGFEFLKPARSGRTVIETEELGISAGEKRLLDGA